MGRSTTMDWLAAGFMSPAWHERIEANKKRHFEEVLVHQAEDWDEDKTKFKKTLVLRSSTFVPFTLWEITPYRHVAGDGRRPDSFPANDRRFRQLSPNAWYSHMVLPRGTDIDLWQGHRRGTLYFDNDVVVPRITRADGKQWMSYTPAEVLSQRQGLRLAVGTVVLGGLGMGWLLTKVCRKATVKRVVVVEKDQGLLNAVGPQLRDLYPRDLAKVTDWICGDVYDHIGKFGSEARHLLDIWDSFPVYDRRFELLRTRVPYLWGWGCLAER